MGGKKRDRKRLQGIPTGKRDRRGDPEKGETREAPDRVSGSLFRSRIIVGYSEILHGQKHERNPVTQWVTATVNYITEGRGMARGR